MDFFKEFSKQFSNVARSVSEKNREGAELGRLNGALRAAEEALEGLYGRYGRACYDAREGRGDPDEAEALALRIRAAIQQAEELAAARDAVRALKKCAGCGAVMPKEARYCSACGKKLPEEAPRPEPVAAGTYCPACGAEREDGPRCPVCGADYDAPARPEPGPDAPVPYAADAEEPDGAIE